MLKIYHRNRDNGSTELKLKGAITDSSVNYLRTECTSVIASGDRLVIDLGSVVYIDSEGEKFLKGLMYMNEKIVNIPIHASSLIDKN